MTDHELLLKARELLAVERERLGLTFSARRARAGHFDDKPEIRAIIQAMRTADTHVLSTDDVWTRPIDGGKPDGDYVLVPRVPTEAMIEAAEIREDDEPLSVWGDIVRAPHDAIYAAMLAAAPAQPPAQPPAVDGADILVRARTIVANLYRNSRDHDYATWVMEGKKDVTFEVRAAIAALRTAAPVLPEVTDEDVEEAWGAHVDTTSGDDDYVSRKGVYAALNRYRDRVMGK